MTDKLRGAAQQAEREAFERALAAKPDARFWNTADAMFWAWQARAALAQQDAQKKHKPLFAEMIAQHPGLAEELAQQDAQAVPHDPLPHGWSVVQVTGSTTNVWPMTEAQMAEFAVAALEKESATLNAAPTPPAQRVMLTSEEIEDLARGKSGHSDFARAVIEAYERKNGKEAP